MALGLGADVGIGACRADTEGGGIETVLHLACRDRNVIGMQSDRPGCLALGLKNILAVTGDPPKLGNYPNATAVFER